MLITASAVLVAAQPGVADAAVKGNAKAYAFMSQVNGKGPIARWNPCDGPIVYRVNLARAPKNILPEVKTAFTEVAKATGLKFTYAGTTNVMPFPKTKNPSYFGPGEYPTGTDIIVAWANPGKQSTLLPTGYTNLGQGGGGWTKAYTLSGAEALMMTRGNVVLNANKMGTLARGFGAHKKSTTGSLLMHEIGHAVGLDHPKIKDKNEIMYPQNLGSKAVWGAGDLAGLKKIGSSAGCLYSESPKSSA
ncbi:M66 family metalloprotease [Actinoplanes sp. CA-131856]